MAAILLTALLLILGGSAQRKLYSLYQYQSGYFHPSFRNMDSYGFPDSDCFYQRIWRVSGQEQYRLCFLYMLYAFAHCIHWFSAEYCTAHIQASCPGDQAQENLAVNETVCYIVLDVNGLKKVNDTLGHHYGDDLICRASRVVKEVFSSLGTCYRMNLSHPLQRFQHPVIFHISQIHFYFCIVRKLCQRIVKR